MKQHTNINRTSQIFAINKKRISTSESVPELQSLASHAMSEEVVYSLGGPNMNLDDMMDDAI